ncbi:MAG: 3-deoxy-manno-octulosonate cytidylyltransferase [Myxococcota bacterium]
MKDITMLIPLRLASKRLKGKPLLKIGGTPIFVHIFHNIKKYISSLYIATADNKIIKVCEQYNIPFIKTSHNPRNGSERIAEAVKIGGIVSPIIVDLQGDEIDADYDLIKGVVKTLIKHNAEVSTAISPIKKNEIKDEDTVKAVLGKNNKCIFFTRAHIPHFRNYARMKSSVYRHIGIYCYKRETLLKYSSLKPTYLERCESLEQMRLIENGIDIFGYITNKNYRKVDNINEFNKIREKKI